MTDPISNERLAELAYEASKIPQHADLCSALRELQSRRQSPAEVEPVAYRWRGPHGGWIYDVVKPSWPSEPVYTSPPPKAVTISDGMVTMPAREARKHAVELEQCAIFAADAGPSIAKAMTDAAACLRAALSSEAHNG